jgi:hypothetical protein
MDRNAHALCIMKARRTAMSPSPVPSNGAQGLRKLRVIYIEARRGNVIAR